MSSWVMVMMWQPTESAWRRLSTSRGLAHSSSLRGIVGEDLAAAAISGTGSRPVSAIRPANTETMAAHVPASASWTVST